MKSTDELNDLAAEKIMGWAKKNNIYPHQRPDGTRVVIFEKHWEPTERAALCVNALNGISSAALESDVIAEVVEALGAAKQFIENGVEYGYITMPDCPDPALDTLPKIKACAGEIGGRK